MSTARLDLLLRLLRVRAVFFLPVACVSSAEAARFFFRCSAIFSAATCSSYSFRLTPEGMTAVTSTEPFLLDFDEVSVDFEAAFLERKMEAKGCPFFLVDAFEDAVLADDLEDCFVSLVVLVFLAFFPLALLVVLCDAKLSWRGGGLEAASRSRLEVRLDDVVTVLVEVDAVAGMSLLGAEDAVSTCLDVATPISAVSFASGFLASILLLVTFALALSSPSSSPSLESIMISAAL
mmetsp:Transcript_11779/g.25073  ORF Transcript_11779/g.25073 Transcript_11779/m.25073 type:complete len:235 (+) Transcript_11779:3581-4285(+)